MVFLLFLGDVTIVVIRIASSISANLDRVRRFDILRMQEAAGLGGNKEFDLNRIRENSAIIDQMDKLASLPKLPLGLTTVLLSLAVSLLPIVAAIVDFVHVIKT